MDVHVLERIWEDGGTCFAPTIEGWYKDHKTGKYKARSYKEGASGDKDSMVKLLKSRMSPLISHKDWYFCPVQFIGTTRKTEYSVPNLCILWADLDEADPRTMHPKPTIAWHSSSDHYQAIWVLSYYLPTKEIEKLNKALSYKVGADKSGWDLTQLLRIPGSYNFKRTDVNPEPEHCKLLWDDGPEWDIPTIRSILKTYDEPVTVELSTSRLEDLIKGWKLTSRTRSLLFSTEAPIGERSDRLWELEKLLVEAGMPVALIVDILKLTVWDKFKSRPDHLLAEVLKAEKEFRVDHALVEVTHETPLKEKMLTYDAFMEMDLPQLNFMVDGFLVAESVGICAGEPKTMKSTLMLDMAVSVASGKPFLGVYNVHPNPVLYIQEENNSSDIKRRFTRISYSRRVLVQTSIGYEPMPIPLYIMNNEGLNLKSKEDRDFIDGAVEEHDIKLLILDPWYMMCGDLNENDAGEVGEILKYLTTLRNRFGCTVMLVHHFKKGEATRGGQRMRGTSVFHSWIECGLYSELNKGQWGNIIMEREFRAFPTNKGLNIVWNTEETTSLDYDVQVHDVSDAYIKKAREASSKVAVEDDVLKDDVIDMMDLSDLV